MDGLMIALAITHAAVVAAAPTVPVIAVGVWWNSNTIAHGFIHRPFRRRPANWLFGAYLTLLLGIPQSLWRKRHLAHHAGRAWRLRLSAELAIQSALVLALWAVLAARAPAFFFFVYLPGYVVGLVLCALHGHYEHAGEPISHYGKLYNLLCFNDGYHAEHHAAPGVHWSRLPDRRAASACTSAWPAPFRWMEAFGLQALERIVLRSGALQRFVLRTHAQAFRAVLEELPPANRVAIVGGGLFPRTALILQQLLPRARIVIIDENLANLDRARTRLNAADVEFVHARYTITDRGAYDLVVIPLSFDGDRRAIYARPPGCAVIVHDWIWNRRGTSRIVSVALLKRINLVRA